MTKIHHHQYKGRKGIDDLKGALSEWGTEYWTASDWEDYKAQQPANDDWNLAYIARCKADGTYGEEYTMNMSFVDNPMFDQRQGGGFTTVSFKSILLDMGVTGIDR